MLLLLVASVVLREWLGLGLPWTEDLARWMLTWTVFLGVAVASRGNQHISMEVVYDRLPARWQGRLSKLHALVGLALAVMLLRLGLQNTERVIRLGQTSRSGDLPAWIGYSALPVGFALVVAAYATYLLAGKRRPGPDGDAAGSRPRSEERPECS